MDQYYFSEDLMLRTPFFSYQEYDVNKSCFILKDDSFKTALYLANPVLYGLLEAKHFDWKFLTEKEKLTLTRYYNRMCFRPTPFGAFSSFSVTQWGKADQISIVCENSRLHVQLDQEAVLHLASSLVGIERLNLTYQPNSAMYKVGRELRFIKTHQQSGTSKFDFSLESFEYNKVTANLMNLCNTKNNTGSEICLHIKDLSGCTDKEAEDYFNFLVNAQILMPETQCNIIGEDYLSRLLNNPLIAQSPNKQALIEICEVLNAASTASAQKLSIVNKQVNRLLASVKIAEKPQVFYSGLERKIVSDGLNSRYKILISKALNALQLLVPPVPQPALQQFIKSFKTRYDRQKIPLLQALDPEIGLGYGNLEEVEESILLKDVKFKKTEEPETSIKWTAAHRLILEKWNRTKYPTEAVVLNNEDLETLKPVGTPVLLPASVSVMFRVIDDDIYLETAGGITATALSGRFSPWSKELLSVNRQIVDLEQAANPEVIFAEVGQISDAHADNINRREHCYPYEIPVNVFSTLPRENQITLSDLLIFVERDQLVLESITLKKEIVPRLSSAYNFNRNQLAVFRFLCELQYQNTHSNLTFNLENLFPGLPFYPKVMFNSTVLCPAKWYLSSDDILLITRENGKRESDTKFEECWAKLQLPSVIALTRFDQQLVFDISNHQERTLFVNCIRGIEKVLLQEFLLPKKAMVTLHESRPLIDQFIAFLYKKEPIYRKSLSNNHLSSNKVKREFLIGSKWVFLKIYCHPSFANTLLAKKILPMLRDFDQSVLLSWFFIRYHDSGYHLRIRLKVNEDQVGTVITRFKNGLSRATDCQLIQEYQADVYRREMERYGADTIEKVEDLFHSSSELIINFIKRSISPGFRYSYHSLAFVSFHQIMEVFLPDINDQLTFLKRMADTFYAEFSGPDKSLKVDMDMKYRHLKSELNLVTNDSGYFKKLKLNDFWNFFTVQIAAVVKSVAAFSEERRNQLLADLIHMHLNRLFTDQQRKQELIIYYSFYKHKLSEKAMLGKS